MSLRTCSSTPHNTLGIVEIWLCGDSRESSKLKALLKGLMLKFQQRSSKFVSTLNVQRRLFSVSWACRYQKKYMQMSEYWLQFSKMKIWPCPGAPGPGLRFSLPQQQKIGFSYRSKLEIYALCFHLCYILIKTQLHPGLQRRSTEIEIFTIFFVVK